MKGRFKLDCVNLHRGAQNMIDLILILKIGLNKSGINLLAHIKVLALILVGSLSYDPLQQTVSKERNPPFQCFEMFYVYCKWKFH